MSEQPVVGVAVLQRFPVRVWARQREYYDGLLREFNLMLLGRQVGASSAPARLVELADQLTSRFGTTMDALNEEREAALRRGELSIDSRVPMVEGLVGVLHWIRGVFAEVDAYCEHGDMLTLAIPADLKALRDWSTAELERQYRGAAPTPWAGPLE
jgi:hypothetical protein